jgi:hypothetical protein
MEVQVISYINLAMQNAVMVCDVILPSVNFINYHITSRLPMNILLPTQLSDL